MINRMPTEQRREQITKAAIKIIGEKGLRAFTIANIAQEVGIRDGSIFRHFKNKDEIVEAVLDYLEKVFAEAIPPTTSDPLKRLTDFFLKRIELLTRQPGIQSLVFSDQLSQAGGDVVLQRVTQQRLKAQLFIKECIQEASQKKLIRPELHLDDVFVIFHGAVMSLLFLAKNDSTDIPIGIRASHVLDTLMFMIRR